jgi:Tfp pilus assembly protein PilX
MQPRNFSPAMQKQHGVVLVVGLIMLLLVTLIGVTAVQTTTLQEKMAANQQERHKALQAAEAAARYGWSTLNASGGFDMTTDFINNSAKPGLYDLRLDDGTGKVVTTTGNKRMADWAAIASAAAWPWGGSTERAAMPNKVASGDPMQLAAAPQYAIGMYAPVLRKGTENRKCIQFSIIGAGQGSQDATQALVQLQVIPKGGCFRDMVK